MIISIFGVLGFFENLMKAMGRIPRELACACTDCASSFEESQIPLGSR